MVFFLTRPLLVEGDGLEAPLSFEMTQWLCYCIGGSFVIGWRKEILWTRDDEGLH